jgi:hypothetical protein
MLLSTGFLFALVVSFSSCKLGAGWGSGNADDQSHRHLLGAKDISKQVRDSVRKPWLVEEVPEVAMNTPSRTTRRRVGHRY